MFRCARAAMGGLVVLALVVAGSATAIAAEPGPVLTPGQNLAVELPDGASADFHPVDPAASGGEVQAVQLDVHVATAVSADGTVSALGEGVQISAKAPDGTGLTSFQHDVTVQPATKDTPAYVSDFIAGVELTFPVTAEQLAGVDPATLGIWSRESATDKWTWVPSAYDPKLGAVVAQSDHLSEFALMAAPAAATTGPRIALDPDDNLGHALWNGTVYGELPLSYDVATQVKAKLESECGADVLITRDASTAFVSRTTRANLIKAQNADIALTLAFNTYNTAPGED